MVLVDPFRKGNPRAFSAERVRRLPEGSHGRSVSALFLRARSVRKNVLFSESGETQFLARLLLATFAADSFLLYVTQLGFDGSCRVSGLVHEPKAYFPLSGSLYPVSFVGQGEVDQQSSKDHCGDQAQGCSHTGKSRRSLSLGSITKRTADTSKDQRSTSGCTEGAQGCSNRRGPKQERFHKFK